MTADEGPRSFTTAGVGGAHDPPLSKPAPDAHGYELLFRHWHFHRTKPAYPIPPGCQRVHVPFLGYLDAGDEHRRRVDRFFHVPMLVLALAVLPILALEFYVVDHPEYDHAVLEVLVTAALVFIWLAFLVEFIVKIAIAPSRMQYAVKNWLDIVIILLPMLRPLRGARALRVLRVAKYSRVFMLRGVAMKLLRTGVAFVLTLKFAQRVQARFGKAKSKPRVPDGYEHWPRSALIAELHRLNRRVAQLEKAARPSPEASSSPTTATSSARPAGDTASGKHPSSISDQTHPPTV